MGKTLGVERIEPSQNLMDLGLDSLMAVEFRTWLKSELECPLGSTLLFDCPTLEAMADYLLQRYRHSMIRKGRKPETSLPLWCRFDPRAAKHPFSVWRGSSEMSSISSRYLAIWGRTDPFMVCVHWVSTRIYRPIHGCKTSQPIRSKPYKAFSHKGLNLIAGYSFGGKVSSGMAHQLLQRGHEIALLAIIDIQIAVLENEKRVSQ